MQASDRRPVCTLQSSNPGDEVSSLRGARCDPWWSVSLRTPVLEMQATLVWGPCSGEGKELSWAGVSLIPEVLWPRDAVALPAGHACLFVTAQ